MVPTHEFHLPACFLLSNLVDFWPSTSVSTFTNYRTVVCGVASADTLKITSESPTCLCHTKQWDLRSGLTKSEYNLNPALLSLCSTYLQFMVTVLPVCRMSLCLLKWYLLSNCPYVCLSPTKGFALYQIIQKTWHGKGIRDLYEKNVNSFIREETSLTLEPLGTEEQRISWTHYEVIAEDGWQHLWWTFVAPIGAACCLLSASDHSIDTCVILGQEHGRARSFICSV